MVDFFEQLALKGIEVREHTTEVDEFKICCLFCQDRQQGKDFKFKLGFNVRSGLGHCFKCGWSSRKVLLDILRKIGSESFGEIKAESFTGKSRERPENVELPEGYERLKNVASNDPLLGPARRYVRKRGITPRQLSMHEIGATATDPWLHHRIIFPVRYGKLLAGIVARDWTGTSKLRYINTTGNKVLYNVHPDRYEKGRSIIVVAEGIPKALAIERATEYRLVSSATMGNHVTSIQSNQLKMFDEVVFFPDPDVQGMTGYLSAADNIQPLVKKVSIVWPWPNEQADDMSDAEIREVLEGRQVVTPLLRMKIKTQMRER